MYDLIRIHIHDKTNNSNDSTVNENSFSSFAGERLVHDQTDTGLESPESKREEIFLHRCLFGRDLCV